MKLEQQPVRERGLTQRIEHLRDEWVRSIGFFCLVFTFFIGVEFLLDAFFPVVSPQTPFHRWGEPGVILIGGVFVGVSIWDAFISRREGYALTVVVLCGFGILSSIHPLNIVGITFYLLVLAGIFGERFVPPKR